MPSLAPTKIVCVGRNYVKHAAELGNDVPTHPLLFLKPPSALLDEGGTIVLPSVSTRVDYEGEIGVVVGKRARNVAEEEAWAYVGALVAVNDVTARDLQKSDGQWSRAKGFDTFCPAGTPKPTADVDVAGLGVVTRVNGEVRQDGLASDMVFSIPFLVSYISRIMTLEPGDLICTGTPEGIGPLAVGDEVEVTVHGVGSVRNVVAAEPA